MLWKKTEPMEPRIEFALKALRTLNFGALCQEYKDWWSSGGQRYEPLTVRDEHSRYVIEVCALEDARSETVRESIERLFEQQGCPPLPVSCFLLFPRLPALC